MALFRAVLSTHSLRLASQTTIRCLSSGSKGPKKGEMTFAHPIEHATGDEKKILLLEEKGITDPYYVNAMKRGPGTKDKPNIVPSFEEKRLVGCVCEEDATTINWMWVHKGDPRRCECGYWFKCEDAFDHFATVEKEASIVAKK